MSGPGSQFIAPTNTIENCWCSGGFRGYKMGTLTRNGFKGKPLVAGSSTQRRSGFGHIYSHIIIIFIGKLHFVMQC